MRIKMAAMAAAAVMVVAGCGGSGAKDAALLAVWNSYDEIPQKANCEAAIQNGENFYGPAKSMAYQAGNGATEYDAQKFLLETCPDAWLMGGDR